MNINDDLRQRIDSATAGGKTLRVTFTIAADGKKAGDAIRDIVRRAEAATGDKAAIGSIFENINSFIVEGSGRLIEEIAKAPEVVSAISSALEDSKGSDWMMRRKL